MARHHPAPRVVWAREEDQQLHVEVDPSITNHVVQNAEIEEAAAEEGHDEAEVDVNELLRGLRPVADDDDALRERLENLTEPQRERLQEWLETEELRAENERRIEALEAQADFLRENNRLNLNVPPHIQAQPIGGGSYIPPEHRDPSEQI